MGRRSVFCRSITGEGVRQTLRYIQQLLPGLMIREVPSGFQALDWTVCDEWNIRDAYVKDEFGNIIIDFKDHNLHVLGYSEPVNKWVSLDELNDIYSQFQINLRQFHIELPIMKDDGDFV